jgi:hypothetical protein
LCRKGGPRALSLCPAGWPSGQAAACKAAYTGSIPVPASRIIPMRALSSGGERFPDTEEVGGSNPPAPTANGWSEIG